MIITEIERAQMAWFHFEEGLTYRTIAKMYETTALRVLNACNEFGAWYEQAR